MDIQEYIDSGILEFYCLGNLTEEEQSEVERMMMHPAVKLEVEKIHATIAAYADEQAVEPPAHLADAMSAVFENLEKEEQMQADSLPLINKHTNYKNWLELVQHHIPEQFNGEPIIVPLTQTASVIQMLMISATAVPDEVHENEMESFLVLQGKCICTIGDTDHHMQAGDFIEIPLYAHHDVRPEADSPSEYVVAVMQRVAV